MSNNNPGNKKPWNNWNKPWFKKKNNNNNDNNNKENNSTNGNTSNYNKNNNYQKNYNNNNKRPNFNQSNNSKQKLYQDNENNDVFDTDEADVSHAIVFDSTARDDENIIDPEEHAESKFPMWNLYFTKEKLTEDSDTVKIIKDFMHLFLIEKWETKFDINKIIENHSFDIDFKELCLEETIKERLPNFEDEFPSKPEFYLNCIGIAMHQSIINRYALLIGQVISKIKSSNSTINSTLNTTETSQQYSKMPSFYSTKSIPAINVRMLNYNSLTRIKDLKAVMYNQFVSLTGTVVKISNTKPFVKRLAFECKSCKTTFQLALVEGQYETPTRCVSKICNSKIFIPMRKHFMTKVVQWQKLKLQEVILDHGEKDVENGRIPRTIECELTEELTRVC